MLLKEDTPIISPRSFYLPLSVCPAVQPVDHATGTPRCTMGCALSQGDKCIPHCTHILLVLKPAGPPSEPVDRPQIIEPQPASPVTPGGGSDDPKAGRDPRGWKYEDLCRHVQFRTTFPIGKWIQFEHFDWTASVGEQLQRERKIRTSSQV